MQKAVIYFKLLRMSYVEESVSRLKKSADTILAEEALELKRMDESHLISGKMARFTIFNAHLNILKQKLAREIKSVLDEAKQDTSINLHEMEQLLNAVCVYYVNEYMGIDFIKD